MFSSIKSRLQSIKLRCSEAGEGNAFDIALFSRVEDIPFEQWNKVLNREKLLLTIPYLAALEVKPARNMSFHYAIVYKDIVPVAILYFQEFDFALSDISKNVNVSRIENLFSGLKKLTGISVIGNDGIALRLLVSGNTFTTGEFGFHHTDGFPENQVADIILLAVEKILQGEKKQGRINGVLLKDFYKERGRQMNSFADNNFHAFHVQPSMELMINPEWKTFEDYLNAFSSKYRVRAKSVLKKGVRLVIKELDAEEILKHYKKIQQLYLNVEERADFQLVTIGKNYFYDLKIALENNFIFQAYFLADEMVAFSSLLQWNGSMEANFVGLNYEYNLENCIYQNILYYDVKTAIERKVKKLYFGRTAMEIKSTVGAEPHELLLFVKHNNSITNSIVGSFMANLKQPAWIQRKPFKEANDKVKIIER